MFNCSLNFTVVCSPQALPRLAVSSLLRRRSSVCSLPSPPATHLPRRRCNQFVLSHRAQPGVAFNLASSFICTMPRRQRSKSPASCLAGVNPVTPGHCSSRRRRSSSTMLCRRFCPDVSPLRVVIPVRCRRHPYSAAPPVPPFRARALTALRRSHPLLPSSTQPSHHCLAVVHRRFCPDIAGPDLLAPPCRALHLSRAQVVAPLY